MIQAIKNKQRIQLVGSIRERVWEIVRTRIGSSFSYILFNDKKEEYPMDIPVIFCVSEKYDFHPHIMFLTEVEGQITSELDELITHLPKSGTFIFPEDFTLAKPLRSDVVLLPFKTIEEGVNKLLKELSIS